MRRDAFGHGPGVDTCLARGCLNSREIEMEMPASQTGVCETFQLEIMGKKAVKHPRWKLTWGGYAVCVLGKKREPFHTILALSEGSPVTPPPPPACPHGCGNPPLGTSKESRGGSRRAMHKHPNGAPGCGARSNTQWSTGTHNGGRAGQPAHELGTRNAQAHSSQSPLEIET